MRSLETELKKAALSDKESQVYLACLELGPASVQTIARKAGVVRVTTYLVLESLMKRGLVTHYTQGKKAVFVAESPHQLVRLIEREETQLHDRRQEIMSLLPTLEALAKTMDDKPTVRYFAGVEGLQAMRREMLMYSTPQDVWYSLTPIDRLHEVFGEQDSDWLYNSFRKAKNIRSRTIFSTENAELRNQIIKQAPTDFAERKYISHELFNSTSGLTIYKDRIAIGTFSGKIGGIIIESQSVAEMMRQFFMLLWNTLDSKEKSINS